MVQQTSNCNGVNGTSFSPRTGTSLGKDNHVQQVVPDRYHATTCNNETIRIGTWNVRLYQYGTLENVKQEMEMLDVNILGICETRWKNNRDFLSDESRVIYSDGQKYERGVGIILDKEKSKCAMGYWQLSDRVLLVKLRGRPFNISIIIVCAPTSDSSEQEMDQFYNTLDNAKLQCKSQEINIVMGDLNAKVGEEQDSDVTGKHGLGTRNERGERWDQWCTANDQIITNT